MADETSLPLSWMDEGFAANLANVKRRAQREQFGWTLYEEWIVADAWEIPRQPPLPEDDVAVVLAKMEALKRA